MKIVTTVALLVVAWVTLHASALFQSQGPPRISPQLSAQVLAPSPSEIDDEFVGPFSSWANIKSTYGAVGDGVADDTAAFQRAFNDLGREDRSPTLFVPAGRYRITETLTLVSQITIAIVGEHPATTALVWDGADGGTMLDLDGVAYSALTRFTFDGQSRASVAIEQSWRNVRPNFDTGNAYTDLVLQNVEYGIHGGFRGYGFAETTIARVRFLRNTKAGVALGNFNALDIWVWHSIFEDCGVGVTNDPGAGNYHVYDNVFTHSIVADMAMQNTGGFAARGNVSVGSKAFFVSGAAMNHPAAVVLQGNTVIDFEDNAAVRVSNQGPGILLDNTFRSREGASSPVVSWRSFIDADLVSIGNTFTVPTALFNNGRLLTFDDTTTSRARISWSMPRLPGVRPAVPRDVIDVPAGATADVIQAALNSAAASHGTRPVVHLPYGRYAIDRTLTLPSSDLQLVGDGARTLLDWSGTGRGPVIRIAGPTRATLRDLTVRGDGRADGIVTADIDRPDSRIYLEGTQLTGPREHNLAINGLRNTIVHVVDSGHSGANHAASVRVAGGDLRIYSGASSNNALSYEVSEGSRALVRDIWYEGAEDSVFLSVHGRADVAVDDARIATPRDTAAPAIRATDFDGRLAIVGAIIDDRIVVQGDGSKANIAAVGLLREFSRLPFFTNDARPPAQAVVFGLRQRAETQGALSPGSVRAGDVGRPEAAFMRRMLDEVRGTNTPALSDRVPDSATDLRFFRVWVTDSVTNLLFQ
ncbi:MAG: glycoside hydrolase family 55 protein [Acidobacteriaceae bacterium]|jgi:hypothetical protein|nr:glycoside hydrolase family 55 protein [Acidobacteriaceae bacterium]